LAIKIGTLVENPTSSLQNIYSLLEIEYNDSMLNFDQGKTNFLKVKEKGKVDLNFGKIIADFNSSMIL